jgi:hypothetical protein
MKHAPPYSIDMAAGSNGPAYAPGVGKIQLSAVMADDAQRKNEISNWLGPPLYRAHVATSKSAVSYGKHWRHTFTAMADGS